MVAPGWFHNGEARLYEAARLKAEDDLDWMYSVAPTLLDLGANPMDPDAGGGKGWEYTDRQIAAAERARPIRRALVLLSGRDQTVIRLRFEPCGYRGPAAVDYLMAYGPKLAAIVRHFRPEGTKTERRLRAECWVAEAVRAYVEASMTRGVAA